MSLYPCLDAPYNKNYIIYQCCVSFCTHNNIFNRLPPSLDQIFARDNSK